MMKSYVKKSLSLEACMIMTQAAVKKAEDLNLKIAITILDESGILKLFHRMDFSQLIAVDASRKKAMTAVGFGIPSGESWYNFIKNDPILLHGVQQFQDFILLGGGFPIMDGELVIGAIGISGGHYKQDEECVKAALEAYSSI